MRREQKYCAICGRPYYGEGVICQECKEVLGYVGLHQIDQSKALHGLRRDL